jgi:anti-sigma B factor antagonist
MDSVKPKVSIQCVGDVTVVTLTEPRILEQSEIDSVADSIMPLIENGDEPNLVIDFEKVEFCSSAVLGLLIRISKKIYQKNGSLGLCSISSSIFEIFQITRLNTIFDIYETQSEAIAGTD